MEGIDIFLADLDFILVDVFILFEHVIYHIKIVEGD